METDAHEDRCEIQPILRREEPGQRDPQTQQCQRQNREGLFFDNQQHEHGGERKKPWNFPQAL